MQRCTWNPVLHRTLPKRRFSLLHLQCCAEGWNPEHCSKLVSGYSEYCRTARECSAMTWHQPVNIPEPHGWATQPNLGVQEFRKRWLGRRCRDVTVRSGHCGAAVTAVKSCVLWTLICKWIKNAALLKSRFTVFKFVWLKQNSCAPKEVLVTVIVLPVLTGRNNGITMWELCSRIHSKG